MSRLEHMHAVWFKLTYSSLVSPQLYKIMKLAESSAIEATGRGINQKADDSGMNAKADSEWLEAFMFGLDLMCNDANRSELDILITSCRK